MGTQTCGFLGNATITTTTNVALVMLTIPVPTDCGINATLHVTGRDTVNGDCFHKIAFISAKNIAGVCTLSTGIDSGLVHATTNAGFSDLSMGACLISLTTFADAVILSVTGLPLTNIDWFASAFGILH